jgi:hypothetical protein
VPGSDRRQWFTEGQRLTKGSRSYELIWNKRHHQPGPCPRDQHRTDGYPHCPLIATLVETVADDTLMMCAALAVSLARSAGAAAR